jgi:uncharacterized protein DUF2784
VKDIYVISVGLVVALHFAFLLYLVVGGFLALRWRWTILLHILVVLWGVGIVTLRYDCPLTWLEQLARRRAGLAPLQEGFIDHYITGVLYPANYVTVVEGVVASIVIASWILFAVATRRRSVHL